MFLVRGRQLVRPRAEHTNWFYSKECYVFIVHEVPKIINVVSRYLGYEGVPGGTRGYGVKKS